ncbi:MAG: FtsX-like permease family protein, partial [Proteobacteria bacterium]|nr:FtsX-like permease family protein [Pseudomonadota bacterium]
LGFFAQFFLTKLLSSLLHIALPPASLKPLGAGIATAMLTLAGFALPPIAGVIQTPPMRVMRAETGPTHRHVLLSIISISLAMAGFLIWQAGEVKLAGVVFAGLVGGLGLMLLIAWLLTRAFRQIRVSRETGWQLGLANIGRYAGRASLLITTIGVGIFALSLLGSVREDLIVAWQNRIPEDAPNHFMVNIQPADLDALKTFLAQRGLDGYQLYPMIRGRLRAINGQPVTAENFEDQQAQDTLRRELNLTTTYELPPENTILAGQWFREKLSGEADVPEMGISVESVIAKRLGIGLNDKLEFDIAGRPYSAPISSLREVQWDTMQPNFYIIASPGALDDFPNSYITSVRINDSDTQFTTELVKAFPNITVLDVRAILNQIQRIITQVSSAVEVVFAFSLLAGIVVLLAAIQTQRNDRRQEIAILKTLGASQRQIKRSVASEFVVLGALAGIMGAGMALLTGWVLAEYIFNLSFQASWYPVLWGLLAGIVGLGGVGYSVIHQLISTPPTRLLQEI